MQFVARPGRSLPASPVVMLGVPSHGNLGQMAIDCLISSLVSSDHILATSGGREVHVEQLGLLTSEWVSAVTGYDEFCPAWGRTLCMPMEVYGISGTSLLLIQQRAPCLPSPSAEKMFAKEFMQYLSAAIQPHLLIVLCGSNLQAVENEEVLQSNRFFDIKSNDIINKLRDEFGDFSDALNGVTNNIPWSHVEALREGEENLPPPPSFSGKQHCDDYNFMSSQLVMEEYSYGARVERLVPGSSLIGRILSFHDNFKSSLMSTLVIGKFCQEGNNVGDAVDLANKAACLLGVQTSCSVDDSSKRMAGFRMRLSYPKSWDSLLGPPLSLSSSTMF